MALEKKQKFAIGFLTIFSFLVIVIWAAQFKQTINKPFEYRGDSIVEKSNLLDFKMLNLPNTGDPRGDDTDQDGLSDWDELNIHKTSPYLEDSDSDGISDGKEIAGGSDPNCPVGTNCGGGSVYGEERIPVQNNNYINSGLLDLSSLNLNNSGASGQANQADLKDVLSGKSNAQHLRQMLLDFGINQDELDQISDDVLMQSYQETLKGISNQ